MNGNGELKKDNGSNGRSDDVIIQTASDSVVAAIVLGMLFTALLAWTDIGSGGDFGICTNGVEGLGFWIYERDETLCWFSITGMIWAGIFATILISPLTFPLCFIAILISRRKGKSRFLPTDPES